MKATATARDFTKALVNQDMYACSKLGYVAILDGNVDYTRVIYPIASPVELMRAGFSASEAGVEYRKYWEEIHRAELDPKSHIKFGDYLKKKEKTFNCNSGRIAIVMNGKYYVTKVDVDTAFLLENGFKKDINLFVPFSWDETYYTTAGGCIRG